MNPTGFMEVTTRVVAAAVAMQVAIHAESETHSASTSAIQVVTCPVANYVFAYPPTVGSVWITSDYSQAE